MKTNINITRIKNDARPCPSPTLSAYGVDWNNVDLENNAELKLVEPLTFATLLLEINCNLPAIDSASVTKQFETDLESRIDEAREIFAANLKNIVNHAKKSHEN